MFLVLSCGALARVSCKHRAFTNGAQVCRCVCLVWRWHRQQLRAQKPGTWICAPEGPKQEKCQPEMFVVATERSCLVHTAGQMVIFPPHPFFLSLISQGQYKSLKVTFKTSLPLSTNSFAIISGKQNIFSHRRCISPIYFRKRHCSRNKGAGRRFKN